MDAWITGFAGGEALTALAAALLLGLRHATDPDHLAAVSTLVVDEAGAGARGGARRAGAQGLAWGLGHAATVFVLGLPVVLLGRELPAGAQRTAEVAVGLVIVGLAARLLLRWRRGRFHSHRHRHGELEHSHPHFHEPYRPHPGSTHVTGAAGAGGGEARPPATGHSHRHADALGRSPTAAFGIGLVHGVGGSAAAAVLLVAAAPTPIRATLALGLFAAGTALSMALVSALIGAALDRRPVANRLQRTVPVLGLASLAFGVWYALNAL